ncbi:FHA domain-containing protein [Cryobacterium sp. SO1]|uniref:FHA domain-containing protein n=1 Tax=Cryobacterium sp. SO1 TaxID=1897061 RepID=UPI00102360BF|nr:FHA domain-containing protein [Cryobacterium sp. SO1]RZI34322.1 hypothetical protein BJQ95_03464 [Cryobacterium sp. SO1]
MGGSVLSYDDDIRGGWLAGAMADRLVLFPAAGPAATARVWESLIGPGPAEQAARAVLDELTAGGLSKTPPFALLSWDTAAPATMRVFVRGDVVVVLATADGDVSIGGLGISTWVERSVMHVTGVDITAAPVTAAPGTEKPDADLTDANDHAALPLGTGLPLEAGMVRTRRLHVVVDSARAVEPVRAGPPSPVAPPLHIVPPVAPPVAPATAPATAPAPLPVPQRTIAEPVSEQTIAGQPFIEQTISDITTADPAVENNADLAGGYDHLFGATVMRGVEQAAVRPDAEDDNESVSAPDSVGIADVPGDHDGHTVMSGDIQKLRDSRRRNNSGSASDAPTPVAVPRLYLLLPSGVREPLNQPIRVGRAPSVSKMSGDLVPRLVSLGGADQDVSRNHVHFTVEGDTVVVTDLHSRNGTLVSLPGKPAQKLRQGEPTAVIVGTVIDLGSGITITVGQE